MPARRSIEPAGCGIGMGARRPNRTRRGRRWVTGQERRYAPRRTIFTAVGLHLR